MASVLSVGVSSDKLAVTCQPSPTSWTYFVGFIVAGIASALYATDCLLWKFVYVVTLCSLGVWYLGSWEEVVFDKSKKKLQITAQNIIQKYGFSSQFNRAVNAELDDVLLVKAETLGNQHVIVVTLVNRVTYSICHSAAIQTLSVCQELAERIHNFLQLDLKHAQIGTPLSDIALPGSMLVTHTDTTCTLSSAITATPLPHTGSPLSDTGSPLSDTGSPLHNAGTPQSDVTIDDTVSATSSEESFERIDAADLNDYDAPNSGVPGTDTPHDGVPVDTLVSCVNTVMPHSEN